MSECDFQNGHAVLESGSGARLGREKMVYMAVKDPAQGDEEELSKYGSKWCSNQNMILY